MRRLRIMMFMAVSTALALATTSALPPVDPGTWALKDASAESKGAVILEQRMKFQARYAEYAIRIRILSAAGKSAAEFSGFDKDCYDITGVTLQPDGKVLPFIRSDMSTKTVVKVGSQEQEQTVVVAPGVTDDCIVDLAWKESKPYWNRDLMEFGGMERVKLSGAFPVKHLVLEIPEAFPWAWKLLPGPAGNIQESKAGGNVVIDIRNLPAVEDTPYSLGGIRPACRLNLFPISSGLRQSAIKGPDAYWLEVGHNLLREYFESGIDKGKAYRGLLASLSLNLPAEPGPRAVELLKRLDRTIRNTTFPTHAEEAAETKKQAAVRIDSKDLDGAAKRGATDSTGMMFLYRELLKDLGLHPQVALVLDRDRAIFDRGMLCWQQFTDILIGVPLPDGTSLWFDPSLRYAPPGVISEHYQGTPGLLFDSGTWDPKPFQVPLQGAAVNIRQYEYTLNLGEDEDQFLLKASFTGLPEYQERRRYLALGGQEQDRLLTERLEKRFKGFAFTNAKVMNATDPGQNLAWQVEGRTDREAGRRRSVDPFPANPWAFWIPDRLEASRKEMIVFPNAEIFQEICHFRIPRGYSLGPVKPYAQANEVGKVQWTLERSEGPEGEACRVVVRVQVDRPILPAASYDSFKAFLGWVREACGRTLILERR